MDIERIRQYCLAKPGVEEGFPFGETVLVFKVLGKVFALLPLDEVGTINLKCDPQRAIELRAEWEEVQPGYHMNKQHWNTVLLTGRLKSNLILELIDHSYDLVVKSLPKKQQESLR
jgi:predicted DNA-binding protein (MmcQ/YjbR family)